MLMPYTRNYEKPEVSEVGFIFFFSPPNKGSKSIKKFFQENICHHVKKPDSDNLHKFYMDCMEGLFFDRDSSVSIKYSIKIIHPDYPEPQTVIRIFPKNIVLTPEDLIHYGICDRKDSMLQLRSLDIPQLVYA